MAEQGENKGAGRDAAGEASGFAALLATAEAHPLPPVEHWDPPYCGDIGFEIRRDGTWYYQGSPIGRRPLVKLFSRILRRDSDGQYYLVTPVEKVLVRVEEAPFLAVEMDVRGAGAYQQLTFRTNVDDIVACDADHPIRFVLEPGSGGLKPFLLVRGRLEALATRSVYYELVELATEGGHDGAQTGLWSGGAWFALAQSQIS